MDIIEQIEDFVGTPHLQFDDSKEMFDRMADFITGLEPDNLTDDQLQKVMEIINDLQVEDDETDEIDMQEVVTVKADPSSHQEKSYARKYYEKNQLKIRKKAKILKRSSEGRKRRRMKPINLKKNKSRTGRPKRDHRDHYDKDRTPNR